MTQPLEKIFAVTAIGTNADDWLSTSGNKVNDVKYLDEQYIYARLPIHPGDGALIMKIGMNLGGSTFYSEGFVVPHAPLSTIVEFFSAAAPGGSPEGQPWTFERLRDVEIGCSDNTFITMQDFKTNVMQPIIPWNISSVGIRATIQGTIEDEQVEGDYIEIRVLQMVKVLRYL